MTDYEKLSTSELIDLLEPHLMPEGTPPSGAVLLAVVHRLEILEKIEDLVK